MRFSCLKHGYTVHTSFDVVVPYPEFVPKISLKCHDYAVFNTNNFLYAIKISLENCERKCKDDQEEIPYHLHLLEKCVLDESSLPPFSDNSQNLTSNQKRAQNIKEQIIRDFSEEINLNSYASLKKTVSAAPKENDVELDVIIEEPCQFQENSESCLVSPALPTRMTSFSSVDPAVPEKGEENIADENNEEQKKCSDKDCFRCPMSSNVLKTTIKRENRKNGWTGDSFKAEKDCSKKYYKSFFSRHKVGKNNLNFGMLIRNNSFVKSNVKPLKSVGEAEVHASDLESRSGGHRFTQACNSEDKADRAYEFVDDTQHEVEKLSQFRRKRLADKKYEFQDFDSENIVPFSIVRLRSPRKSDCEADRRLPIETDEKTEIVLRSPSPRFALDLSISVPSPRSPLILEILSSPTQHEGVLRPLNRNTNQLLSPMAKFLASPPNAQKLTKTKDCLKSKGCDDFKTTKTLQGATKNSTNLDTRLVLEHGILINDISERYLTDGPETGAEIYSNLFRNSSKFHGEAVRFERRFIEVDDELVSVITDIEDDDMSTVTGYHTALNVEVHGAGYVQLQMVSNSKAGKLLTPRVVVDQQSLDIEGICHSVATTLCQLSNKTFTFCNDYDIEVLDVSVYNVTLPFSFQCELTTIIASRSVQDLVMY